MSGNVRIKTCDLEIPLTAIQPIQQQPATTTAAAAVTTTTASNAADSDTGGRAVDNQYSFV